MLVLSERLYTQKSAKKEYETVFRTYLYHNLYMINQLTTQRYHFFINKVQNEINFANNAYFLNDYFP